MATSDDDDPQSGVASPPPLSAASMGGVDSPSHADDVGVDEFFKQLGTAEMKETIVKQKREIEAVQKQLLQLRDSLTQVGD